MLLKDGWVVLVALLVTVAAEEWSWGPDETSHTDAAEAGPVPGASAVPEAREETGDREARFLGLRPKLCALGIGDCPNKKHLPVIASVPHKVEASSYTSYKQPGPPHHAGKHVTSSYTSYSGAAGRHPLPQYTSVTPPPPHHHKQVIQHHHTHIHHTSGGVGGVPHKPIPHHGGFKPLPSLGGITQIKPSSPHLPHPHPHGPVHPEAVVPDGSPVVPILTPGYREECVCVHASLCNAYDVIGRELPGDIHHLIDPRTLGGDILSNDTVVDEDEDSITTTTTSTPAATTTTTTTEIPPAAATAAARVKRDLLPTVNNTAALAEGRALSYRPGAAGCGAAYVCCQNPLPPQRPVHKPYKCGRGNPSGVLARVKNPDYIPGTAAFGEFPWQVAILKNYEEYVCGGVLVDDRHVLTAAHCVHGLAPHNLKVRLGDWDVAVTTEFYRHVELPAEWVVEHPDYYGGDLSNDIAIIRFNGYLDFAANPHIVPVCLPDTYASFVGQRCVSTGWGKDAFGGHGTFQRILHKVEVPVVGRKTCEAALAYERLGSHFRLSDGALCAGGEAGRDTCEGDGGGPLVCAGPGGAYQLAGLVSWGLGCGREGVPGVYVDVPYYAQWIHEIISAL